MQHIYPTSKNPFYPQSNSYFFLPPSKPFSQVCPLLTHIHFSHIQAHSEIIISVPSAQNKLLKWDFPPWKSIYLPPAACLSLCHCTDTRSLFRRWPDKSSRISSFLVVQDACVFPSWPLPSQMLLQFFWQKKGKELFFFSIPAHVRKPAGLFRENRFHMASRSQYSTEINADCFFPRHLYYCMLLQ